MRNGTSQSPFRPALGRQLVRAADAPLRGHGFGTSRLRQTPTTNGLTAYRMRLHLACVSSGTYGPFATSASRSRLRLPRTTRLALRASLAGSVGLMLSVFARRCTSTPFHLILRSQRGKKRPDVRSLSDLRLFYCGIEKTGRIVRSISLKTGSTIRLDQANNLPRSLATNAQAGQVPGARAQE